VLRADSLEAQMEWRLAGTADGVPVLEAHATLAAEDAASRRRLLRDAAIEALTARAEPSRWTTVHFNALAAHARAAGQAWPADEPLASVQRDLERALGDMEVFVRHGAATASEPTTGLWYLRADRQPGGREPLADRVEVEVARRLADGAPVDEVEFQGAVCDVFRGAETPGRGLVMACLASYAERQDAGLWQLRQEDRPEARAAEVRAMIGLLAQLAARLGFQADGEGPHTWREAGRLVYHFEVSSSATLGRLLGTAGAEAARRFLVLPGGRAGLAEHKLRRDPRLRPALEAGGWTLVKFRHLRRTAAEAALTRETLEAALAGDPLEAMQQLALLE
jgi:hypothetical protein